MARIHRFLILFLLCPIFAHPVDDITEDIEKEEFQDDVTESVLISSSLPPNDTEEVDVSPLPRVKVPPLVVDVGEEKKTARWKAFEKDQNFYTAQIEIWPRKVYQDDPDILEMNAYCYATEVSLFLRFSAPFYGYIYPFHHFRRCHLFTGNGQGDVNLLITEDSCGLDITYASENGTMRFLEFTFLVQWDTRYITEADRKLRVTCNRADTHQRPVIFTNTTEASTATVFSMRVENEVDDDDNPKLTTRGYDPVQVGEDVTVVFTFPNSSVDANVLECIVHDGRQGFSDHKMLVHTYDTENQAQAMWVGSATLLTMGCSTDETRMSNFDKLALDNGMIELSSEFHVFRFPSSHFLFLECRVQVCLGKCPAFPDCSSKLKVQFPDSHNIQTVTLFRPLMVKLGSLMNLSQMDEDFSDHGDDKTKEAVPQGVPTASFIAGLVGMGFVCAIICVFMYRRFKKGTEKDYKMQYSPQSASSITNSRNREEVAPLKVTTNESPE